MRILHLSSLYPPHVVGGAEKVAGMLAEEQVLRGHVVGAAYLSPPAERSGVQAGVRTFPMGPRNPLWIEDSARFPSVLRILNKTCTVFNVTTAHAFRKVLKEFKPDVVHTHSMVELPPFVWSEVKSRGIALAHTLHDYDLLCVRGALFYKGKLCESRHLACRVLSRPKQILHTQIDAVVGISKSILDKHMAEGLFEHLPPSRRHVIWNPVVGATQGSRTPSGEERPFTFGFIGRLVPEKGLAVLLQACRRLRVNGWRLIVAGRAPGAGQVELERMASGLPVEFLGFVETAGFFQQIDALVVPSVWAEPFGLVVIEAFAAGVPVIGSDIGAIGEVVGAATPEWLFTAGDVEQLQIMLKLAIESGRVGMPSEERFRPVLDRVGLKSVVAAYDQVYEMIVSEQENATAP